VVLGCDLNLEQKDLGRAYEPQPNRTRYSTVFNSRASQYAQFCVRVWRLTFPKTSSSPKASV
ncbi:MAG: hypothetical protein ACOVKL_04280, partial [Polynucleobacter sp.]